MNEQEKPTESQNPAIRGQIIIAFDTGTGKTIVSAAMDNQEMKNLSIKVLLQAISIIMDYKASPIIKAPSGIIPGNGKILTH
jgi:hypothetical protein